MIAPARPALRYHGSKWRIAPWIISHFPKHRIYVECYGGGAGVLLRKRRSYAEVYNDLDGEVVNFFRVLRERTEELVRLVALTPYARDEYRRAFEPAEDPLERARRTVTRSFMGFGSNAIRRKLQSGFRATCNRQNTTAASDWANLPPQLRLAGGRFAGVTIENRPAVEVIEQQDSPETLHYLDPPYVHETRYDPSKGYEHEMTDADHEALAGRLHHVRGMVVLSGYHSPLYDRLYAGWETAEREALGDGACKRLEVLWFNPAARAALRGRDGLLFDGQGLRGQQQ